VTEIEQETAPATLAAAKQPLPLFNVSVMRHDCSYRTTGVCAMLKEVGASGQISLGKRLAGQLFHVVFHPGGRVELLPMRAVPSATDVPPPTGTASDGWLPPGGYEGVTQWALDNRAALEAYAQRIEQNGTAAEQLQHFLSDQTAR
jgi:hypothetical protein